MSRKTHLWVLCYAPHPHAWHAQAAGDCRVDCCLCNVRNPQLGLSIQHMERVLGDRAFVDMMGGRQPRLVAAMKSLPLRDNDAPANSTGPERDLVARLTQDCSNQLDGRHAAPLVSLYSIVCWLKLKWSAPHTLAATNEEATALQRDCCCCCLNA